MGAARVLQRQPRVDQRADRPCGKLGDQIVHRLRAERRFVVEGVHGEDADRGAVEISRPGVERVDHIRLDFAEELAVGHQEAERSKHREELGEVRAADRIENEIDADAAGDRGDSRRDILAAHVDDMVGAERLERPGLLVCPDQADRRHAGELGQLHRGTAEAARRRTDQHRLPRRAAGRGVQEMPGHLIVRQTRPRLEVGLRRQREQRALRHRDIFGVASGADRQFPRGHVDFLADGEALSAGAKLRHRAGHLDAGDCRQRRHPGIDAAAYQQLGAADPDGVGLDQHLAGLRAGRRHLDIVQN